VVFCLPDLSRIAQMFYSVNRQYSGIKGKSPQYLDHPSVKLADFGRSPEGMDTEKRIRFTRGDVP
jgi:hypothetical protein